MRAVLQRIDSAQVIVDGDVVGAIDGEGLLALVGVTHDDGADQVATLARKIAELRILRGERSVLEAEAGVLVVSQFTLYGDARHGRRPSFTEAEAPDRADELYRLVVEKCEREGLTVGTGVFRTYMKVALENDGPVTILLDSEKNF